MTPRSQSGVTLIELVLAIVVISMAGATIVGLLSFMSRSSAEVMAGAQSATVANAYLNRILSEEFDSSTDDISSYDGDIYVGVTDGLDNPVAGLDNYRVAISVQSPGIGTAPNAVSGNDTRLVTVTVTDPLGGSVRLSGMRTRRP